MFYRHSIGVEFIQFKIYEKVFALVLKSALTFSRRPSPIPEIPADPVS
jgi:hypothetical protein